VTKQRFDLVVRDGIVVTPGHREQADVGITGGRIAQLGGTMTGAGESTPTACWRSLAASTPTCT
jgi:dihydroorotase-like cyclic amidohydrolase